MSGKNTANDRLLSQGAIINRYGVNKRIIDRYFHKPVVKYVPGRNYAYVRRWKQSEVEQDLKKPEVIHEVELLREAREAASRKEKIRLELMAFTPENMLEKAKELQRCFVLHVGPTNSGKTHDAIEALMESGNGTYLGPLRLLALEMYDRINAAGIGCSLLTGEESIPCEGAEIVSSTVELCNFRQRFKTAVIDEAQLIADPDRGAAWLKAICLVDAEVVHICLAPEALDYIEALVGGFGDPYSIVKHERLVPLEYKGRCHGYRDIHPADAIICFSRKNVLSTAALLERNGFRASVIYGALPPEARRNEVRKYTSGETNVIVATDAIGMGISLPIRRVIFAETHKFDGTEQRALRASEVRQIAGRAGRYGMFELGEVLTMDNSDIVEKGLKYSAGRISSPCIAFPREMLESNYPIGEMLAVWNRLPENREFRREDMKSAAYLLSVIKDTAAGRDRNLVFDLITCPVDTNLRELVSYWQACARAILRKRRIPLPWFETDTLMGCELQYKAYDVHHQLLRRISVEDDCSEQRAEICRRIAQLMAEDKGQYIRKCKNCGCELPLGYAYNLCKKCFNADYS